MCNGHNEVCLPSKTGSETCDLYLMSPVMAPLVGFLLLQWVSETEPSDLVDGPKSGLPSCSAIDNAQSNRRSLTSHRDATRRGGTHREEACGG